MNALSLSPLDACPSLSSLPNPDSFLNMLDGPADRPTECIVFVLCVIVRSYSREMRRGGRHVRSRSCTQHQQAKDRKDGRADGQYNHPLIAEYACMHASYVATRDVRSGRFKFYACLSAIYRTCFCLRRSVAVGVGPIGAKVNRPTGRPARPTQGDGTLGHHRKNGI